MMATVHNFKVGDVCLDCQQLGLKKHLRYFKLNLKGDTLLKCESNECMYPYNDEIYSSSDEDTEDDQGLKFIDDFIQQYKIEKENEIENELQTKFDDDNKNPAAEEQFDLSFLNNFQYNKEENLNKQDFSIETEELVDVKANIKENELHSSSLTNSKDKVVKIKDSQENLNSLDIENMKQDLVNQTENTVSAEQNEFTKELENQLALLSTTNEKLSKNEFSMQNVEILENNLENITDFGNTEFTLETVQYTDQKENIKKIAQELNTFTNTYEELAKPENSIQNMQILYKNIENNNENFNNQDLNKETVEYMEHKVPKENLQNIQYPLENIEFLEYKNIKENLDINQIISLPLNNTNNCQITTAAIVHQYNNLNSDNNEISFLSIIGESPTNESKQNIVQENKPQIVSDENVEQLLTFTTLSNDSIKDCKPKIDIQSIETIKMDEPLYNILPNLINTQTNENSKQHSNSIDNNSKQTKRKYKPRIKTEKKSLKTNTSNSNTCTAIQDSSNLTESTFSKSATNCPSPSSSLTSDIPKANILKGAELLKKLALADKKNTKLSTKMKAVRNNKKSVNNKESKVQVEEAKFVPTPPPSLSLVTSESDFSLDNVAEMLIANKMKRKTKQE